METYHSFLFKVFLILFIALLMTGCSDDQETFYLKVEVVPHGMGFVEGEGRYKAGETVVLTATPETGHDFFRWMDQDETLGREDVLEFNVPFEDVTLTAFFGPEDGTTGSVTDIEGNTYSTVFIAGTEWMAENLRTVTFRDGTPVPRGDRGSGMPAYDVYLHEHVEGIDSEEEMVALYGKHYNWHAVTDPAGICPEGWEVPGDADWHALIDHLREVYDLHNGHADDPYGAGNALRSCRQVNSPLGGDCDTDEHPRWISDDNHYGQDLFGFEALPAGYGRPGAGFSFIGEFAAWWSSSEVAPGSANYALLYPNFGFIYYNQHPKFLGFNLRCIRKIP